jgi:hypothetical protein
MGDPNKRDKKLQDALMIKAKRVPASEADQMLQAQEAKKKAVIKMRDKGMEDIVRALSKQAIMAEKNGDIKTVDRLANKIEKVKQQVADEKKSSGYKKNK